MERSSESKPRLPAPAPASLFPLTPRARRMTPRREN